MTKHGKICYIKVFIETDSVTKKERKPSDSHIDTQNQQKYHISI